MDHYFNFGEDQYSAKYLLFNIDAAFRRKDITNSTFQESFDQIFIRGVEQSHPGVEIAQKSPIKLHNEYARLYDRELLTWGMVEIERNFTEVQLSDQTSVQGVSWSELKDQAMQDNF